MTWLIIEFQGIMTDMDQEIGSLMLSAGLDLSKGHVCVYVKKEAVTRDLILLQTLVKRQVSVIFLVINPKSNGRSYPTEYSLDVALTSHTPASRTSS